ncbi:MAG: 6-bladed beta-propeller [Bacteroidota bacterium]
MPFQAAKKMKRCFIALLFFSLGVVCANISIAQIQRSGKLIWPAFSDTPRIVFTSTISSFRNIENKSSNIFEDAFNLLLGNEEQEHQFVQPVGITISVKKKLYVTDPGARGVHVIDMANENYHFIANTLEENLLSPVGITISEEGMLYVSDSEQGKIIAYDEDYDVQFEITEHLMRPTGLLFSEKVLYVTDAGRHAVVAFTSDGKFLAEYGRRGSGTGEFNYPIQLAASENLYIVDALNYRIQEIHRDGMFSSSFGTIGNVAGKFASPKGIAIDSAGFVYVTDAMMDNFQIFNREKKLMLVVGTHGSGDGEFMSPGGIAIDRENNIYVVDMLNRRIQIFQMVNYK